MSSIYTGDKTATQAPSPTPATGSAPEVVLPADGDALNAASVAQAFKVPVDFANFEQGPFADASQWAKKIRAWKDARNHTRFGIDHWGKPVGCYDEWVEDWATPTWSIPHGVTTPSFAGAAGTFCGRWNTLSVGAANVSYSYPPATAASVPPLPAAATGFITRNASRTLIIMVDGSSGSNRNEWRLADDCVTSAFASDTLITLDMKVAPLTVLSVIWVMGFASQGQGMAGIADGVYFARPNSAGANWQCITVSGGSPTGVDSGISASATPTMKDFRIELVGDGVDDASTSRALFYIDGALKANITTTLPVNTGKLMIPIFGGEMGGTTSNPLMLVGPVRYSQITDLATP